MPMDRVKTAQAPQFSRIFETRNPIAQVVQISQFSLGRSESAEKLRIGFLCLSLISFMILNSISGMFPPFISLILLAVTIVVLQPYLSTHYKGLTLRKIYFTAIGIVILVIFNLLRHPANA